MAANPQGLIQKADLVLVDNTFVAFFSFWHESSKHTHQAGLWVLLYLCRGTCSWAGISRWPAKTDQLGVCLLRMGKKEHIFTHNAQKHKVQTPLSWKCTTTHSLEAAVIFTSGRVKAEEKTKAKARRSWTRSLWLLRVNSTAVTEPPQWPDRRAGNASLPFPITSTMLQAIFSALSGSKILSFLSFCCHPQWTDCIRMAFQQPSWVSPWLKYLKFHQGAVLVQSVF